MCEIAESKILVTGATGFIGSNLVTYLLKNKAKKVRVLDNLSTGYLKNIAPYQGLGNFEFIEKDIKYLETRRQACEGMDCVLYQATLGYVPRSINGPATSNEVNVSGFLNVRIAVRDQKVKRVMYAASSSTYGDGTISRDFTYVYNVVQANIKAMLTKNTDVVNQVCNVACGTSTSINKVKILKSKIKVPLEVIYGSNRFGGIAHTLADISKAKEKMGYVPEIDVCEGLKRTVASFRANRE